MQTAKKTPKTKTSNPAASKPILFLALLRELSTNTKKILEVSALGAYLRQMIQESVIMPSQVILSIYLYQDKENRLK